MSERLSNFRNLIWSDLHQHPFLSQTQFRRNMNDRNCGNNGNNNNNFPLTTQPHVDDHWHQHRMPSAEPQLQTQYVNIGLNDDSYESTPIVPHLIGDTLYYTVPSLTPIVHEPNAHLVVGQQSPGCPLGWTMGPHQELHVLGRSQHYSANGWPIIAETGILLTTTVWSMYLVNALNGNLSGWLHVVTISENGFVTRLLDGRLDLGGGDGVGLGPVNGAAPFDGPRGGHFGGPSGDAPIHFTNSAAFR